MPSAPLDADRGSGPGPAPRRALGLLALFYFAHFSALGAYNPLFPRWLEARGIEGLAMGAAAATSPAMGLVAPPVFGFLADTLGLRGWLLRVVCAGACLASGAIALSAALGAGAGALFLAIAAFAFCRVPIIPMTDVVALEHIRRAGMPYARLRVWGSVGFALTATAAGSWIDPRDPAALPALIAAAYGVAFVVSFGLPARAPTPPRPVPEHVRALLRGTDFRLFLAVSFLAQGAHAAHDLCLTLHLRDLGFPLGLAGGAWAAGVLAEVLLMAFGGRRVARASQPKLLAASLAGAALRWALLATVRSPAALLALQPLHAVSFGLMWLASIGYLDRRAPPYARATAQGLFTASVCAGSVIGLVVWGPLYERAGGAVTFGAASAVAGLAFVLAIPFCRRSDAAGESSAGGPSSSGESAVFSTSVGGPE